MVLLRTFQQTNVKKFAVSTNLYFCESASQSMRPVPIAYQSPLANHCFCCYLWVIK